MTTEAIEQQRKEIIGMTVLDVEKNKLKSSIYLLLFGPPDSVGRQITVLKLIGMLTESGYLVIKSFTGDEIFRSINAVDETSVEITVGVLTEGLDFINKYPSLCVLNTFSQSDWETLIATPKIHRVEYLLKTINWQSDDVPSSGDIMDIWSWCQRQKALLMPNI